jgi:hypothetical protein
MNFYNKIIFLFVVIFFNVNLITAQSYDLMQDDQYVQFGTPEYTFEIMYAALDPFDQYDFYIVTVYDGFSWSTKTTGLVNKFWKNDVYVTSAFVTFDTTSARIAEISFACNNGCAPSVARVYFDDGTLFENPYGVDAYFDTYVSPQYAYLSNLETGFAAQAASKPIDGILPIETTNSWTGLISTNNVLNTSFNGWNGWLNDNFINPILRNIAVDIHILLNIIPWILTITYFFDTISPVIPVTQFIASTTLIFVLWNTTLIIAIYDRIRKFLI